MQIKKNDNVKVLAGKDRGKTGVVTRAFHADDKVVVDGVNLQAKWQKSDKKGEPGNKVMIAYPIHVSNVALLSQKSDTKDAKKKTKTTNDKK